MFTLHIHLDGLDEAAAAAEGMQGLDPKDANEIVRSSVHRETQQHFRALESRHRPNVHFNFYAQAVEAVTSTADESGAEVKVNQAGIAQRFYGGHIQAINHVLKGVGVAELWIPCAPESEGRTSSEFHGLVAIVNRQTLHGVAILPGPNPKTGKPSTKYGQVLFALVPDLDQDPDESVLPTDDDYLAAISASIGDVFGDVTSMGGQS